MNIDEFALALEYPEGMKWSESYELVGKRLSVEDIITDGLVVRQDTHEIFWAICKLCRSETKKDTANTVTQLHFEHCSREHEYVFPVDSTFKVEDETLQQVIRAADLYDLPLPGLEDHKGCVRQYAEGNKIICAVHKGNEYITKHSLIDI